MKFETIRSKKKILLIGIILFCIGVTLILTSTLAAYKKTTTIKIAEGTINYTIPDMKIIAINVQDGFDEYYKRKYKSIDFIEDISGLENYYINKDKSYCEYYDEHGILRRLNSISFEINPNDYSISINASFYAKNTKCYVYLDKYSDDSLTTDDIVANSTMGSGTPNFVNTSCTSGSNNGGDCGEETVGLYCWDVDTNKACTGTSTNKTYFYRGDVEDNYVTFAGAFWRIIRINENGSLRLIYAGDIDVISTLLYGEMREVLANGYDDNGNGNKYARISFEHKYGSNTYTDYIYFIDYYHGGYYTQYNTSQYDSGAKQVLDKWYENNLLDYTNYLDNESGYCNDLSIYSDASWCGRRSAGLNYARAECITNKETWYEFYYYGANGRLYKDVPTPTFRCQNSKNDLYTPNNNSNIGNEKLNYPVGLITADEIVFAGGNTNSSNINKSFYLYIGEGYWTITPDHSDITDLDQDYIFAFTKDGYLEIFDDDNTRGDSALLAIRPVINLKSNTRLMIQDISKNYGTWDNPYVVVTS